jgi:uncharacterized protein
LTLVDPASPHYPSLAPIDAYGNGGFRFAGMSHRGSLLFLPRGIWAWPVVAPAALDEAALAPVLAVAEAIELFLLGTGREPWTMPPVLRARFRAAGAVVEVMTTGAAVRTYNMLLAERRRIAAAMIAVD